MSIESTRIYRYGAKALIISGVLFLVRALLELAAGRPPSGGLEILAWVESNKIYLSFVSEVLFFAAVALIPSVFALYHHFVGIDRVRTAFGCGLIATIIPVIFMLLVVHGRLVYPVYDIHIDSPDVAANIVAVFYGGMHAVGLLMAGATYLLSVVMKQGGFGKGIAYLGFVTCVLDIVGAYPDHIGPAFTLVCQSFFSAWFIAIGSKLNSLHKTAH